MRDISDDERQSYRPKILPALWVAAAPGQDFVAAPTRCPASPGVAASRPGPAALATQPKGLLRQDTSDSFVRRDREGA